MTIGHVVVVGGSRGLGKVIVERFLKHGYTVSVLARNISDDFLKNSKVNHVSIDLEDLRESSGILERVIRFDGKISYMIFCQRFRGSTDPWIGEIQVGLTATNTLIELFSDSFVVDKDRSIAIISSVYAQFVGSSQPISYHVVKGGLNQLIRFYARELGRKGIRVNGIMPMTYVKPETKKYYNENKTKLLCYERFVPLGRIGDAEDSANAIEFLCSSKASFITGQCLFIDGGVSVIWPEELGLIAEGT